MAAPTIPYTIPGTVDHVDGKPEIVCRISFDSAATSDPLSWVDVSDRLRSFNIERGGENELELVDTGTCTVVLDNRDRELDPFNTASSYAPNVLPRRRLWIESQWDGDTISQFYGWTGAWQPSWTGTTDAIVTLNAQDGFAIASGDALPTTNPPRDSFADLVAFYKPTLYYKFGDPAGATEAADSSEQGTAGTYYSGLADGVGSADFTLGQSSLVVGETGLEAMRLDPSGTSYITSGEWPGATAGRGRGGLSAFTFGCLFQVVEFNASGTITFALGPTGDAATSCWQVGISTILFATVGMTTGASSSATMSPHNLVAGTTHYLMAVYNGTTIKLYLDNVEVATSSPAAAMDTAADTRLWFIQSSASTNVDAIYDELVFYEGRALTTSERTAHFEGAMERGRPQESADERVVAILEESGMTFAPRRLRTAARDVQPIYYSGQPHKDELENAVRAEGDPAMFYFGKDGAAVFLDRDHRSASPWSTVQATFDDDGTDLPYLDGSLEIDDGEAFIYNDVRVTASGGELQQNFDTASISAYQRRVLDRGETLNVDDADADDESTTLLAKYKDPLPRLTSFALNGGQDINHPGVLNQMLEREIGDKVRVIARPVGGGSAINQEAHIRKISLSGSPGDPYCTVTWALREGEAGSDEGETDSADYGEDDYGEGQYGS